MTIHLTKSQIRQVCLSRRKSLTKKYVSEASQKIIDTLCEMPAYQSANHIAWYFPTNGEVDLSALWPMALNANKSCYFPAIQADQSLLFLPYARDTELTFNRYHIAEPNVAACHAKSPQDLDIIFLPVVAFDVNRKRLGMGKGYYDKTLALHPGPLLIGVAYEWQRQPNLPIDPWDIPLTTIITEETVY